MTDLDALIAEAEIGDQAKAFLESPLGQILLGFAKQEVDEALSGLEQVDPSNTKEIMKLQNQAKFGRSFEGWLTELVVKGEEAKGVFINEQT